MNEKQEKRISIALKRWDITKFQTAKIKKLIGEKLIEINHNQGNQRKLSSIAKSISNLDKRYTKAIEREEKSYNSMFAVIQKATKKRNK